MFEGMQHMARKMIPETDAGVVDEQEPSYPFNLSMTLGDEEIKTLGLDCDHPDCEVGNYVHMHILAEIKGVHKTEEGVSLNLQVTHMECENESDEDSESDEEMHGGY